MQETILSVSEFNKEIKLILETEISPRWIRGEISNLKKQSSGHIYFTLKDISSQIACVIFRGNAVRQTIEIKEGQQVLAYGELNVYEPRGNYQLLVAILLNDGQGQLQLAFEQLKQKLASEGLFDSAAKKPIPLFPRTIGIITSPTGAVIRDFVSILKRRNWQGRLVILGAKVQGKDAAQELMKQIEKAEKLGIFELLVICRGGGSLEDLWPFNEESLVRAVAFCKIPIISGIGHEIDFTLTDFAADLRAETPSAAAEIISSSHIKTLDNIQLIAKELSKFTKITIADYKHKLEKLTHRLNAHIPQNYINQLNLRLDDLTNRMINILQTKIYSKKSQLHEIKIKFLTKSPENSIKLLQIRLDQIHKRLQNNSIETTLKRGFVIIQSTDNKYITRKQNIDKLSNLKIIFADGELPIELKHSYNEDFIHEL